MIKGTNVQLHEGAICKIVADSPSADGALCCIRGFDTAKGKWHVNVEGGKASGKKELLVPEHSLRLCYALAPSSLTKLERYHKTAFDDSQGSCGRGLVAAQDIRQGMPIFEEPPLVVAFDSSTSSREHHAERWRAYTALSLRARQDSSTGLWASALRAFEELGIADEIPEHVQDAAAVLAAQDWEEAPSAFPSDAHKQSHVTKVTHTLMRFLSNQFGLSNGAPAGSAFSASAIYAFTSRINHSCSPSIMIGTKEAFCKRFKIAYKVETDAGVKIATALRDIKKGERLTFSYSNEILQGGPTMSLRERRAILERLSFTCGCERCVAEEAAEVRAAAATTLPAHELVEPRATKNERASKDPAAGRAAGCTADVRATSAPPVRSGEHSRMPASPQAHVDSHAGHASGSSSGFDGTGRVAVGVALVAIAAAVAVAVGVAMVQRQQRTRV